MADSYGGFDWHVRHWLLPNTPPDHQAHQELRPRIYPIRAAFADQRAACVLPRKNVPGEAASDALDVYASLRCVQRAHAIPDLSREALREHRDRGGLCGLASLSFEPAQRPFSVVGTRDPSAGWPIVSLDCSPTVGAARDGSHGKMALNMRSRSKSFWQLRLAHRQPRRGEAEEVLPSAASSACLEPSEHGHARPVLWDDARQMPGEVLEIARVLLLPRGDDGVHIAELLLMTSTRDPGSGR